MVLTLSHKYTLTESLQQTTFKIIVANGEIVHNEFNFILKRFGFNPYCASATDDFRNHCGKS